MTLDERTYLRCPVCECTFLTPSQRPNRLAEVAEYRLHRNDIYDAGYRHFLSGLTKPLLARLRGKQYGLDYGCGPGPALAIMLREAGHQIALYDPVFFNDPNVLKRQYDFITCTEVAEHFHHPAHEFQRLNKLLKHNGILAIRTQFQTDDTAFANWRYRHDPTHVVFYRENTFRVLAQQFKWQCEIPAPNVVFMRKPPIEMAYSEI
ncbi:MAG: methyltransferase type 12 [Pusillimonas sp.]|nr:methyltransferase type 12 [Pusillimonas sp.]